MKRVALIAMIVGTVVSATYGQDKQSDVKTLLQLMQTEEFIIETFSTLLPMFEQQAGTVIQGDSATEKNNTFLEYVKSEIKELNNTDLNRFLHNFQDHPFYNFETATDSILKKIKNRNVVSQ